MTYQITDAKMRYFNDKEHYLNFLKAWKKAATNSIGTDDGLNDAHMLMYALLRGKDARSAFKPITKISKLENGAFINNGLYWAHEHLARQKREPEKFLAPFEGTIEPEILLRVIEEMPVVSPIYSNYGKGIAIAELLKDNRRQPAELWKIIEEAA
jgi:hypothetical protein